jgi:hypothetical protein
MDSAAHLLLLRAAMARTYNGFRRNPDGSWTCFTESTFEGPNGHVQVAPGTTFIPGFKYMGVDLAALLDNRAGIKNLNHRGTS